MTTTDVESQLIANQSKQDSGRPLRLAPLDQLPVHVRDEVHPDRHEMGAGHQRG
jgi:hypothetical protein